MSDFSGHMVVFEVEHDYHDVCMTVGTDEDNSGIIWLSLDEAKRAVNLLNQVVLELEVDGHEKDSDV